MTALKWKNPERGVFTCGHWVIRGGGTDWTLYRVVNNKEVKVCDRRQKGLCQDHAEKNPDAGLPKPKPKPVEPGPKPVDCLESVLESLRLEISQLSHMIGILTTKIDNLGS